MNKYLQLFFGFGLLVFLFVGGLNWWVDPFAVWRDGCTAQVNCRKTEAGNKIRLTKAFQWLHQQPQVVILGNSRPELGIDPYSQGFQGMSVYNLSIRGAGLLEQMTYLSNFLQEKTPSTVIMSLDFLDFLQDPDADTVWHSDKTYGYLRHSLNGKPNKAFYLQRIKIMGQTLWSLDTLLASVKTIVNQSRQVNYTTAKGFNQADGFIPIVEYEGIQVLFDQKIQDMEQSFQRRNQVLLSQSGVSVADKAIPALLKLFAGKKTRLIIFISPYHIQYLDVLAQHGYHDVFLQWKANLVSNLERSGYFEREQLYDFSGFNVFTTEQVPKGVGRYMQWYWEPAHYRSQLGDRLVEQMMGGESEFQLTPDNYRKRLAGEQALMAARRSKNEALTQTPSTTQVNLTYAPSKHLR